MVTAGDIGWGNGYWPTNRTALLGPLYFVAFVFQGHAPHQNYHTMIIVDPPRIGVHKIHHELSARYHLFMGNSSVACDLSWELHHFTQLRTPLGLPHRTPEIIQSDASLDRFIADIAWVYTNRAEWRPGRTRPGMGWPGWDENHPF